jgi:hypothetical protein
MFYTISIVVIGILLVFLPSLSTFYNTKSFGKIKFTPVGIATIILGILLIIFSVLQYKQIKKDETEKEEQAKSEQDNRDIKLQKRYDSSLLVMQSKFEEANNKSDSIVSENLGKYGYKFDSIQNRLVNLNRITTINNGDDPVLDIASDDEAKGIEIKSIKDKEYYLQISLISNDAGSSSLEIKYSFVCDDTTGYLYYHNQSVPVNYSHAIGKNKYVVSFSSIYPIFRPHFIYVWARGKYKNIDKTKSYFFDQVYYYNVYGNTFGIMKGNTRLRIIEKVKSHEN